MRSVLIAVGWLATLAAAFVVRKTTGEDAGRSASAPPAVVLPGAVGEEDLAKYRGWAHQLLETPEGSLPEPVEQQRRRLQQALLLWAPRLSPEDALARLKAGQMKGAEALPVLRRLPPDRPAQLDLGAILAPLVASYELPEGTATQLRALADRK